MLGNIFFKDDIEKKFWYFCWKILSFQSAKLKKLAHFFGALPNYKSLFLPAERQRGRRRKILVFPGGKRINKCYAKFEIDRSLAGKNCIKNKGKDVWNALKKDQKF